MTEERRVYTKEFKEQVVLLTETSGKKVSEIAHDLGSSTRLLKNTNAIASRRCAEYFMSHGVVITNGVNATKAHEKRKTAN
jgi:hypothetical protein